MNLLLLVLSLALAGLAALIGRFSEVKSRESASSFVSLGLLAAMGLVAGQWLPPETRTAGRAAFVYGLGLVAMAAWFGRGRSLPIAMGIVGCAGISFLAARSFQTVVPLSIAGAGLGLLIYPREASGFAVAALSVVGFANSLGIRTDTPEAGFRSGTIIGLLIVTLLIVTDAAKLKLKTSDWTDSLVGVLIAAIGYGMGKFWLREAGAANSILLGGVTGLVVHWLTKGNARLETFRVVLAGMLWVGLASLGFGLAHGFGMALALCAGALVLAGLGNARGLLTSGPLLGLVGYRVFREAHVQASTALDLGQHYALVGLMVGAFLPLIPWDYLSREDQRVRVGIAGALWALLVGVIPGVLPILLAAKGAVGFVAGLGVSPILGARDERPNLSLYGLSAGIAGLSIVVYSKIRTLADFTRDDKIRVLIWFGVEIVVLTIVIFFVTPRKAAEKNS